MGISVSRRNTYEILKGAMGLADFIRERRLQLGMTQVELAESSGVNQPLISDIERGQTKLPNADARRRIARALGIRHLDLLVAAGELLEDELPGAVDTPLTRHQRLLNLVDLSIDSRETTLDTILQMWMDQDRANRNTTELVAFPSDQRFDH